MGRTPDPFLEFLLGVAVGLVDRPGGLGQVVEVALLMGDAAPGPFPVDLGDRAMFGVAQPPDQGEDVESELVVGQGEVGLGLGAVGAVEAWAGEGVAAVDAQGEAPNTVEAGDGTVISVV